MNTNMNMGIYPNKQSLMNKKQTKKLICMKHI